MVDLATLLEPERLDALRRLALENLEPEEPFDRLTRLAATACSAPTALITFVGSDREHFKSALGLPAHLSYLRQLPLTHSLCQYAVATGMSYAVPDTTHDPLILASPAVTELGVMAYAGAPLITSQGHCVGTISVVDWKPRPWTDEQVAMLEDLAKIAITELELRHELVELAQAHVALRESEQRLRLTLDAGKCGIWDWDIPNDHITWSDRVFQVFGIRRRISAEGSPISAPPFIPRTGIGSARRCDVPWRRARTTRSSFGRCTPAPMKRIGSGPTAECCSTRTDGRSGCWGRRSTRPIGVSRKSRSAHRTSNYGSSRTGSMKCGKRS